MEYLKLFGDIITAVAAVVAVILAWRGLHTWQKQLKGTSRYQLAKDTLKAAYRVQETFRSVRHKTHVNKHRADYDAALVREYEKRKVEVEAAYHLLEEKCLDSKVEWGEEFFHVPMKMERCLGTYSSCIFDCTVFGELS
jgi:uncharacterized membrane protein YhiD involved in acid resistance